MARTGGKHIAPSSKPSRNDEWDEEQVETGAEQDNWEGELENEFASSRDNDLEWEPGWEPEAERKRRRTPGWLRFLRTLLILAIIFAVAAFAADMLQKDRFASMTDINGVSVSRMTAEEATKAVSDVLQLDKAVTLTDENGDALAQLNVLDMLRSGDVGSEVTKLLNAQH